MATSTVASTVTNLQCDLLSQSMGWGWLHSMGMGLIGTGHRTESPLRIKPNWRVIPTDTLIIKLKTFYRKVVQIYHEDGARRESAMAGNENRFFNEAKERRFEEYVHK